MLFAHPWWVLEEVMVGVWPKPLDVGKSHGVWPTALVLAWMSEEGVVGVRVSASRDAASHCDCVADSSCCGLDVGRRCSGCSCYSRDAAS